MIGLDANILLRFLTQDHKTHSRQASKLFRQLTPEYQGYISEPVILELYFTLQRGYKLEKADLIAILESLLATKELIIENSSDMQAALRLYKKVKPQLNDCLIAIKCQKAGCEEIFSFDKDAQKDLGMKKPS
ncbi:PIN domain-containing protein [Endozoicomonas arenosclerae]|uniref:PIN domain-containing protein n=1 Tax=Endozoicomonas arenosclerae TaxID=1633495 RepID=UPI0007823C9D|nr:type II toxin-antitoxin system VapC family toxin [Endozoicomonas arenosclerae]